MFRRNKASQITEFFNLLLKNDEVALYYLGVSGFIVRSASQGVIFDPAGMLKNEEVLTLKNVNLLFFTHDHLDHFNTGKAVSLFKATSASVLAEAKVVKKLQGKIPSDKLVVAESGKTYSLGGLTVRAVAGVHRGPIMLFQVKIGDVTIFHGGDSGYVSLTDYPSNIAIVPVGRMSPTASPENAYKMVIDIKPKTAVTMHGSSGQKQQFKNKVNEGMPQTEVLVMESQTATSIKLQPNT